MQKNKNLTPDLLEAFLKPIIDEMVEQKVKVLLEEYMQKADLKSKPEKPIKLKEMAEILGWSTSHLYRQTSKNSIPHHKISSGRVVFYQSEINEWVISEYKNNLKN